MAVNINKGQALGALSLTKLIDVVLLLLIFFLVATKFAEEDKEMEFPLPDASEAVPLTVQPKEMFININNEGRYFVEGKQVAVDELERVLAQATANNPTRAATIRADKRVQLDAVVAATNLCKKVGMKYVITTKGDGG